MCTQNENQVGHQRHMLGIPVIPEAYKFEAPTTTSTSSTKIRTTVNKTEVVVEGSKNTYFNIIEYRTLENILFLANVRLHCPFFPAVVNFYNIKDSTKLKINFKFMKTKNYSYGQRDVSFTMVEVIQPVHEISTIHKFWTFLILAFVV